MLLMLVLTLKVQSMDKDILFKVLEDLEGSSDSRITKTEVGRYCITEPFFIDGYAQLLKDDDANLKWKDMTDPKIAREVILAYWKRYCPKALKDGDIRVLAAVFRKGPRGYNNPTGIRYGKRALALYYEYKKGSNQTSSK